MRGLSLMIRRLIRMIQGVCLRNGLYIGLIMVGSLVALETYLELNNSAWSVPRLLMLLTGILLLIQRWHAGEKELPKKLEQQVSPGLLWAEDGDSLEIQCLHCGKRTIIQCRVVW